MSVYTDIYQWAVQTTSTTATYYTTSTMGATTSGAFITTPAVWRSVEEWDDGGRGGWQSADAQSNGINQGDHLMRVSEFTPGDADRSVWQKPRDLWTLWVDGNVSGHHRGVHVASFHQSIKVEERRSLALHIADVMNRVPGTKSLGTWTPAGTSSIALDGKKAVTFSTHLAEDTYKHFVQIACERLSADVPEAEPQPEAPALDWGHTSKVTFEATAFVADPSLYEGCVMQDTLIGYNDAARIAGLLPPEVMAVTSARISVDDDQPEGDAKIFISVTLLVDLPEDQAARIPVPEQLLNTVAALIPTEGAPGFDIDAAWEVSDTDETLPTDMAEATSAVSYRPQA
jgi:hypothetical protein